MGVLLQCVLYIGRPALVPALARVASASVGGFQCRTLSTSASSQEGQRFTTAASKAFLANSHVRKVLVANRGEIACRVMATAKRLGLGTVAVFSEADRFAKHVQMADEAYCIGGAAVRESYLRADAVLDVARKAGAQAIHPGYGFLSENAPFAEACAKAGISFVGPPSAAIRAMGDKAMSKHVMSKAGVPVVPGYHGEAQDDKTLVEEAKRMGFPILVKAVAGGGGKGMKLAFSLEELPQAIDSARREAAASFGDDRLLLERYITRPRHVEVQVVADSHGNAVYFFDRDCSVQRRHQKIIEEAPAPGLPGEFHQMIGEAAVRAAQAVGYCNAGTVEFIVDVDAPGTSGFYFMEMNTRLQVEHPVSEAVANVDLVELQLVVAAGGKLPLLQDQVFHGEHVSGAGPHGHSFEARLYAETPRNNFLPGPHAGALCEPFIRVDSGVREGDTVGTFYDPMIAKVITWAPDRESALALLRKALAETQVAGLPTNLSYLKRLAAHPAFINLELDTGFVRRHEDSLLAPQVVDPLAAAFAAITRHMTQVKAGASSRPGGAWGVPDSKRLWHTRVISYQDMCVPEASVKSHVDVRAAARAAAHEDKGVNPNPQGPDSGLEVQVSVVGVDAFDVHVSGLPHTHTKGGVIHVRHAQLSDDGALVAEVAGRKVRADVVGFTQGSEDVINVWLDGEQYEFRWPRVSSSKDVRSVTAGASSGAGHVKSPMPGRVVKVLVKEGQQVSAGSPVVLLEAMKMEHPVLAPKTGTVTQLEVAQGMQLTDGQLLMIIAETKSTEKK